MAAETSYASGYNKQPDTGPLRTITAFRKMDIDATSDSLLAENGDKVVVFRLPKNARIINYYLASKGIDTNATATTTLSLKIIEGKIADSGTETTLITATLVANAGAFKVVDTVEDAVGDVLDADVKTYDVFVEAEAAAATAGTDAELTVMVQYFMDVGGTDPA